MKRPPSFALTGEAAKEERHAALSEKYLAAIARLEALPENQSGADKTWVEEAIRDYARHYANAKRVR